MRMLGFCQPQRARQRVDGGDGGANGETLFQPDVQVDADACELAVFLAPQARGPAPPTDRKADGPGRQLFTARSQEIAEFTTTGIRHRLCSRARLGPSVLG